MAKRFFPFGTKENAKGKSADKKLLVTVKGTKGGNNNNQKVNNKKGRKGKRRSVCKRENWGREIKSHTIIPVVF